MHQMGEVEIIIQVTYQKKDGSIIHRIRNTSLDYKIGDITSMGWKVLNIEYKYKDEFYSLYNYNIMMQKNKQLMLKKKQIVGTFKNEIKTILYWVLAVLIINFIKILLGI